MNCSGHSPKKEENIDLFFISCNEYIINVNNIILLNIFKENIAGTRQSFLIVCYNVPLIYSM